MIPIGDDRYYHRKVGEPLHAEREPLSLSRSKSGSELGPDLFDAQYQQTPVPPVGSSSRRIGSVSITTSCRQAATTSSAGTPPARIGPRNSFSVCNGLVPKDDVHYLVDLVRGRFRLSDACDTAIDLVKRYKPRVVLIEDASTGVALAGRPRASVPARSSWSRSSATRSARLCTCSRQVRLRHGAVSQGRAVHAGAVEGAAALPAVQALPTRSTASARRWPTRARPTPSTTFAEPRATLRAPWRGRDVSNPSHGGDCMRKLKRDIRGGDSFAQDLQDKEPQASRQTWLAIGASRHWPLRNDLLPKLRACRSRPAELS